MVKKIAKNKIWLIIILAIAVYLAMGIYVNFDKLLEAMKNFQWLFIILLIFLATISYFIRFLRWNLFLKKTNVKLKFKESLFVFFSGFSMIITPGKIGEIWKGWLIKDINGEKLSKTIPIVIFERVTDVLGLILLSLFGIFSYYKKGIWFIAILILLFILFLIVVRTKISRKIIFIFEKRTKKYSENVKIVHKTFEKLMELKYVILISLLSAFAWLFECLGFYFIILGFSQSINPLYAVSIFALASLLGAISMIPGGLGMAEFTISGLLVLYGINSVSAVGAAIITRLGTLWYGALLGIITYIFLRKKYLKTKNKNILKK